MWRRRSSFRSALPRSGRRAEAYRLTCRTYAPLSSVNQLVRVTIRRELLTARSMSSATCRRGDNHFETSIDVPHLAARPLANRRWLGSRYADCGSYARKPLILPTLTPRSGLIYSLGRMVDNRRLGGVGRKPFLPAQCTPRPIGGSMSIPKTFAAPVTVQGVGSP
ncbi:MAG: hypothetical protein QOF15_3785 [Mycobacterium sp.]|jgi:hypothetical protein|nr:hypothetical protein [Mycobacterium sp.]